METFAVCDIVVINIGILFPYYLHWCLLHIPSTYIYSSVYFVISHWCLSWSWLYNCVWSNHSLNIVRCPVLRCPPGPSHMRREYQTRLWLRVGVWQHLTMQQLVIHAWSLLPTSVQDNPKEWRAYSYCYDMSTKGWPIASKQDSF